MLAQALKHGKFDAVVDPRLQNDYEPTELARMVACAAACVRHLARSRPRIGQVILLILLLKYLVPLSNISNPFIKKKEKKKSNPKL